MTITAEQARALVYAAHDAWNAKDMERLLSLYVDDMTYWSNAGGPDGGVCEIVGKDLFREHLLEWRALEGLCVPHHFRFEDGLGRAAVEFYVTDLRTGHTYSSTYRQIVAYRDGRILSSKIYHDPHALAAFLGVVAAENSALRLPGNVKGRRPEPTPSTQN